MLDISTIAILFVAFVVEAFIVLKFKEQSGVLIAALLLVVNVILFVLLHIAYSNITDPGEITSISAFNYLIDFNLYSVKVRNSVILIGFVALASGMHHQYGMKKSKIYLVSSFILGGIAMLWLMMAMIAGAFII
ncbi:hypothetical protein [uncultured Pontibacter sp.]|uniref:hypothetical protein n=1 Tax=uncultured Pontibacter sp. TaxID=453356 RepID=UPI002612A25C|nr:hypothetical protein [uncultured Pontibacter sp.]